MTRLSGSTVLITGAASGIGRGIAHVAATRGAQVVLWDISSVGLDRVASELEANGVVPMCAVVDVGESAAVTAAADQVLAQVGSVDIVINNAGVVSGKALVDLSSSEIERTFRVNALSNFWTTKAFLPSMIRRNRGHVVTIASAAGLVGVSKLADYSASKHAAVGFDESLRVEMAQRAPGIRTTVVCPYYVNTGMFDGVRSRFEFLLPIVSEDHLIDKIVRAIERDRTRLYVPWIVRFLAPLRILPTSVYDAIMDTLGVNVSMEEFVGRNGAGDSAPDSRSTSQQ
ncbi:MAG: SDR family oxidoreductase [Microthrixaceae bacterium]